MGQRPTLPSLLVLIGVLTAAFPAASAATEPSGSASAEAVTEVPPAEPSPEPEAPPEPAPEAAPPEAAPPEAAAPDEPAQPLPNDTVAEARNESLVFQLTWQVQEGCRRHCHGTVQRQEASQRAETGQSATAGGEAAGAINRARTLQFVWQEQFGCVAYCFETRQKQSASQEAETHQSAAAVGETIARTLNLSETVQFAFQYQESCILVCHGTSATAELHQRSVTTQVATSRAAPDRDGFLAWLTDLALNAGATLQTIFQHQRADCVERCYGGSQDQLALQRAEVEQSAVTRSPAPGAERHDPPPPDVRAAPEAGAPPEATGRPEATGPRRSGARRRRGLMFGSRNAGFPQCAVKNRTHLARCHLIRVIRRHTVGSVPRPGQRRP